MAFRQYLFNKFQAAIPSLVTGQSSPTVIDSTGALSVNQEGRKSTYRVGTLFVPIAAAPAPIFSIAGSNTKVVRITKIRFCCTAGTGTSTDVFLQRYSALSGGTSNPLSAGTLDTQNPGLSFAGVRTWSVAATTAVASGGHLADEIYEIVTTSVSVLPSVVFWQFGDVPSQELVLRGPQDFIGIGLNAVGTAPNATVWMEWTEE